MSVHPLQPKPFFADKNRAFWNLQSLGWAGAFLLRGSSTIANGQPLSSLIPVLISTVTGYSATLLIAVAFRFLQKQRPILTWGALFAALAWAAASYAFSAYLGSFNSYNRIYGSIGAVVALLMWFYLAGFSVMLGALINVELDRNRRLAAARLRRHDHDEVRAAVHVVAHLREHADCASTTQAHYQSHKPD